MTRSPSWPCLGRAGPVFGSLERALAMRYPLACTAVDGGTWRQRSAASSFDRAVHTWWPRVWTTPPFVPSAEPTDVYSFGHPPPLLRLNFFFKKIIAAGKTKAAASKGLTPATGIAPVGGNPLTIACVPWIGCAPWLDTA